MSIKLGSMIVPGILGSPPSMIPSTTDQELSVGRAPEREVPPGLSLRRIEPVVQGFLRGMRYTVNCEARYFVDLYRYISPSSQKRRKPQLEIQERLRDTPPWGERDGSKNEAQGKSARLYNYHENLRRKRGNSTAQSVYFPASYSWISQIVITPVGAMTDSGLCQCERKPPSPVDG